MKKTLFGLALVAFLALSAVASASHSESDCPLGCEPACCTK